MGHPRWRGLSFLDETKRAIPKAARRSSIRAYTLLVRVLAFSGASDDCKGSRRAIMKMHSVIGLIGGAALLTAAPVSLHRSQNTVALSLDSADARIGRPRTALSVAGVQRRGYRRAYRGAVYGAIAGYGTGSYYSGYSSPAYSAPSRLWIQWLRLSELLRTVLRVWLWAVLRRLWIFHRTPLQAGDFSASGVALLGGAWTTCSFQARCCPSAAAQARGRARYSFVHLLCHWRPSIARRSRKGAKARNRGR